MVLATDKLVCGFIVPPPVRFRGGGGGGGFINIDSSRTAASLADGAAGFNSVGTEGVDEEFFFVESFFAADKLGGFTSLT
jgi:hypothetical protein